MLTKEAIKGMKKKELVALAIADQNRLEYLQDKLQAKDLKLKKYEAGQDELGQTIGILLIKVAIEKGTDVNGGKELWVPRYMDVSDYNVRTELDKAGGRIGIILTKKEGA